MSTAALGRGWSDEELSAWLVTADVAHHRPADLVGAVAEVIAANGIVAWFQGRSEYGPRALGHRSLFANATRAANLKRLNDVKGREQFRPSPRWSWPSAPPSCSKAARCPARTCCSRTGCGPSGSTGYPRSCTSTAPPASRPSTGPASRSSPACSTRSSGAPVCRRTGVPVIVNTSLNTAGRPMVDDPRDALECFGSAPIDALAIGGFLIHRAGTTR